jgi:hypothetical protein
MNLQLKAQPIALTVIVSETLMVLVAFSKLFEAKTRK